MQFQSRLFNICPSSTLTNHCYYGSNLLVDHFKHVVGKQGVFVWCLLIMIDIQEQVALCILLNSWHACFIQLQGKRLYIVGVRKDVVSPGKKFKFPCPLKAHSIGLGKFLRRARDQRHSKSFQQLWQASVQKRKLNNSNRANILKHMTSLCTATATTHIIDIGGSSSLSSKNSSKLLAAESGKSNYRAACPSITRTRALLSQFAKPDHALNMTCACY